MGGFGRLALRPSTTVVLRPMRVVLPAERGHPFGGGESTRVEIVEVVTSPVEATCSGQPSRAILCILKREFEKAIQTPPGRLEHG